MPDIEKDWKHYSKLVDVVIEKFYVKVNFEVKEILEKEGLSARDKLSNVYKRIDSAYRLVDRGNMTVSVTAYHAI